MIAKVVALLAMVAVCNAGVLPLSAAPAALVAPAVAAAPAAYIAPYATSYSAHTVNHAVATPVYAPAPLVAAAPAPLVAAAPAPAPFAPAPVISARYLSAPYYL